MASLIAFTNFYFGSKQTLLLPACISTGINLTPLLATARARPGKPNSATAIILGPSGDNVERSNRAKVSKKTKAMMAFVLLAKSIQ